MTAATPEITSPSESGSSSAAPGASGGAVPSRSATSPRRARGPEVVREARFSPKLRTYLYLQGFAILGATVVGIVLWPIWAVAGWWWADRYFRNYRCVLTGHSLMVKKGITFRSESTIPLDKIQDLSVKHGPILELLGLAKLSVVTASAASSQGAAADLMGLVDPAEFRDRVLEQRDRRFGDRGAVPAARAGRGAVRPEPGRGPSLTSPGDTADAAPASGAGASDEVVALLREIRDLLRRDVGEGESAG